MNKKTRTLLLIILLLVVAVVGSRSLWQGESAAGKTAVSGEQNPGSGDNPAKSSSQPAAKASAGSGLADKVSGAVGKGRPVVLVFTYNADCCASTKEFFEKHSAAVKRFEKKYSAGVGFIWIDVAQYSEVDEEGLISTAKKYGVSGIPSVVLIDAKGNPNSVIPGELNEKSVDAKLEGLVKGS